MNYTKKDYVLKIRYVVKDCDENITIKCFTIKNIEDGELNYWLAGFNCSEIKIISRDMFTGERDATRTKEFPNGQDIYEGDIIKIPEDWDEYGFNAGEKYEVCFAFGGFRLKPKYRKDVKGFYLEDDGIKIIGNIYKNPELLESREE